MHIVGAYAPQVGCDTEENDEFWEKLREVVETFPKEQESW